MGLFGKLIQATIKTAVLPVAVVKDAATMGGLMTGRRETYTASEVKDIKEKLEDAYDSLDD